MNQTDPVIEVKNVHKSFKSVKAVKDVSLAIHPGQFVAVLGPNGAGKTTLVEMIEGIQKPDSGEIIITGKHWKGNENELNSLIGLSFQETRYIDKLTVNETLKLFASFYELDQSRVNEITELVGLEDKRNSYVVNLSGGQRQRLSLGIALINKPKILILDEPTTGLDPNARRDVWDILYKLREQQNTSLILTTHYMEEAERLCDYIILMDKGKILKEGTLDQLLIEESGEKIIEFTLDENIQPDKEIIQHPSFPVQWDSSNGKGHLALKEMEKDLPRFLKYLEQNDLHLTNLECRRKTLDDLFITLTGRRLDD
ncbi:MAG: ABC transporter ATP-binding protein [Calditrichaceae bacterium]|jgi:ABC-2 type transport system ATP-binding protein